MFLTFFLSHILGTYLGHILGTLWTCLKSYYCYIIGFIFTNQKFTFSLSILQYYILQCYIYSASHVEKTTIFFNEKTIKWNRLSNTIRPTSWINNLNIPSFIISLQRTLCFFENFSQKCGGHFLQKYLNLFSAAGGIWMVWAAFSSFTLLVFFSLHRLFGCK